MAEDKCVNPAKGPIQAAQAVGMEIQPNGDKKEVTGMTARVGKPAPDFELGAYVDGGFKNIKLSDSKGKWIVVCFYPGDFTFV
jgi:hypothetical protein